MMKKSDSSMPVIMQRKQSSFSIGTSVLLVSLSLFVGLIATTQFFAWRLGFQAALGTHYNHFYFPWRIVQWATAWHTQHQELFISAGSAGVMVTATLMLLIAFRKQMVSNTASPSDYLHGSARWAEEKDIRAASLFSETGVYVGGWDDPRGQSHYLRHNGSEHLLCIAPTRSGKGVCLVIPTLLSWTKSCVITDLKGELWALTAGWRQKHAGNRVLRFEPATADSVGWNPMEEIRLGTEFEIGDAQNLSTCIVDPDGKGLRDHWQKTAQSLLVGCILHLLYKKKNEAGTIASLPAVDAMLADPACPVAELWKDMISYLHDKEKGIPHPVVAQSAQDMLDRPDQERGSVLSSAKSYLALYRDPVVARNVNTSGFKVRELMNGTRPISLYIVTQPADKARLKPLVRVMLNMICRILAEKMDYEDTPDTTYTVRQKMVRLFQGKSIRNLIGGRRAKGVYTHKLLMLLDEFPSLGKLEIVQESLAFLAGYGIRFYLICQDMNQLRSEDTGYGKDEAISSNCHIQNAFQPTRLETAQYLSKLTGQTTVVKEQITVSGKRMGSMLENVSRSLQEVSRPLMTEDECLRMSPPLKDGERLIKGGEMLIYVSGFPAIRGRQMPYFFDPVFQARSRVNPPEKADMSASEVDRVET